MNPHNHPHLDRLALIFVGISYYQIALAAENYWRPLFNGKDLTGWETYLNKPFHEWEVAGLKRDSDEKHQEAIGKNRDPLMVFTVQRLDGDEAAPLKSGAISLQTEGAELFYRNLEIRPIHEIPAEFAKP